MFAVEQHLIHRPSESLHVRDFHSYGGSVLVVRRSTPNRAKQLEALRSLTLRSIGDACVINDNWIEGGDRDSSLYGQAVAAMHACTFARLPFAIPEGFFGGLWLAAGSSMMYREDYTDQRGPGEILVMGDGEYIQVETHGGKIAICWTCDDSSMEFIGKALQSLGEVRQDDDAAYVSLATGEKAAGSGTASDVLSYLKMQEDTSVALLQVSFTDGATATWNMPANRVKGSMSAHAEVSVNMPSSGARDLVFQLIESTASPALRSQRQVALGNIKQFAS